MTTLPGFCRKAAEKSQSMWLPMNTHERGMKRIGISAAHCVFFRFFSGLCKAEKCTESCLRGRPRRDKTAHQPSLFRRLTGPDFYREGGARDPTVPQAALQMEGLRRRVGAYPPLGRLGGSPVEEHTSELQSLRHLLFRLL